MNPDFKTGGPAFPIADPFVAKCPSNEQEALRLRNGMSLRDWFAGKAMQGLLASDVEATLAEFASRSYQVADEMLKAREA